MLQFLLGTLVGMMATVIYLGTHPEMATTLSMGRYLVSYGWSLCKYQWSRSRARDIPIVDEGTRVPRRQLRPLSSNLANSGIPQALSAVPVEQAVLSDHHAKFFQGTHSRSNDGDGVGQ